MMKRFPLFLLICLLLFSFGCSQNEGSELSPEVPGLEKYTYTESEAPTDYVKFEMTTGAMFIIKLRPDVAPITVDNFKKLVGEHFYDGIIVHRVEPSLLMQTGDPDGDGYSNPEIPTIKGEFALNGIPNSLSHKRGVVSMARATNPNSASSQFFICDIDLPSLDGSYAAFGEVIDGMKTVDYLCSVKVEGSRPVTKQVIKTARFVTVTEMESTAS